MNETKQYWVANTTEPAMNTHPGEVIKDELVCRGLSQRQLASEIGVSYSLLNDILNGKRALTADVALLLSAVLHMDAEPWMMMQTQYNLYEARHSSKLIQALQSISRFGKVAVF